MIYVQLEHEPEVTQEVSKLQLVLPPLVPFLHPPSKARMEIFFPAWIFIYAATDAHDYLFLSATGICHW